MVADSQIRRFLLLHKELDPDDDELTRTRKVRRGFIGEKYAALIDALYYGQERPVHRDGRQVRGRPYRDDQRRRAEFGMRSSRCAQQRIEAAQRGVHLRAARNDRRGSSVRRRHLAVLRRREGARAR